MSENGLDPLVQAFMRSPRNRCFACGPGNPVGLHLEFHRENGMVQTTFVPSEWHEGWAGVVHGGILSAVLDETMAYTLFFAGIRALTARMDVRYRGSSRAGDTLTVEARVVRDNRSITDVAAEISREGQIVVEANARFMKLGPLDPSMLD